jgi:26S proteasome regulatory subunit N9
MASACPDAYVFLQITGMKDRLELWCTDVKSMEMLVEHQAQDILT